MKKQDQESVKLPGQVKVGDCKQPKWEDALPWREAEALGLNAPQLTLYHVRLSWMKRTRALG